MATDTEVRLNVKGVDATKQAFATAAMRMAQFAARARVVGLRIAAGLSRTIGQALSLRTWRNAALGLAAALGGPAAAIRRTAAELSALTDRAAQAGTTATNLTQLNAALSMLGAKNVSIDTLSDAFSRMTKATGRVGAEGFRETLEEISRLGSEEERVKALAETFGRSFGPGLAALVRQGPDALRDGLFAVSAAMPAVQEDLAQRADAISDGFDHAAKNLKAGWQTAWMDMATSAADALGMTDRELGIVLGAELRKRLALAMEYFKMWAGNIFKIFSSFDNLKQVFKIVFVDYLGGLLAEGLQKATLKVVEWVQKIAIRFRQLGDYVKAIFTDYTFEEANARAASSIEAATQQYEALYDIVGEHFASNTASAMREKLEALGLKFEIPEETREAIQEQYDRTVASVQAIEEANKAATASVASNVGSAAETVASKISREFKDATAVASTSYQALKIARGRGLAALPGERGESTAATAREVAKNARNTQSILAALRDLLSVERDGWTGFGKLATSFEVV